MQKSGNRKNKIAHRTYHYKFKPAWWLPTGDLQSLWPYFFRKKYPLNTRRERFELIDGDFLDADWVGSDDETLPIVIVLHGLEGSIDSHYTNAILYKIMKTGWRGLIIHFRGCSGQPNRLDHSYHAGQTSDIFNVLSIIKNREPNSKYAAVGYSLGGNVLLKWLGEMHTRTPLLAAVSVCAPLELKIAADEIQHGRSYYYQQWFIRHMRKSIKNKYKTKKAPIRIDNIKQWKTFQEFDENITAPLHGFKNALDYYESASSYKHLINIKNPTLIIQSRNDPVVSEKIIPHAEETSEMVKIETHKSGGHLGFVCGKIPGFPKYWLENRIIHFLKQHLD